MTPTTIAAIATAHGTGGVAIIRLSGPDSWHIGRTLIASPNTVQNKAILTPQQATHRWLHDPDTGELVDDVLLLAFKGPYSFTGEDVLEIHCHGGHVVSQLILQLCLTQGAQPATAGEFTQRALINGKLDLAQAESVLDLIHAQGEALVKLSANNLRHKAASRLIESCLQQLASIQADLTASIDFPDEVEEPNRVLTAQTLQTLADHLQHHITVQQQTQFIRDGLQIALIGSPNAGKSSIFNQLLAADRSIVTDIAGTTRDVITETRSVQGIPVTFVDTAGLRETTDQVELLGVERSWQALNTAAAVLYVVDGQVGIRPDDQQTLNALPNIPGALLWNKHDLAPIPTKPVQPDLPANWPLIAISATQKTGFNQLEQWLTELTQAHTPQKADFLLSQRQLGVLQTVQTEVNEAISALQENSLPLDIATVPLTNALIELQTLLGQDTTEAMLDSVFSRFCVGK